MPPPRQSRPHPVSTLEAAEPGFTGFEKNMETGMESFIIRADSGLKQYDHHGWMTRTKTDYRYHIHPDDPTSACVDLSAMERYGRSGQLDARIQARQRMTCDRTHFHVEANLQVFDGDEEVFSREWRKSFPRDGI